MLEPASIQLKTADPWTFMCPLRCARCREAGRRAICQDCLEESAGRRGEVASILESSDLILEEFREEVMPDAVG